MHRLLLTNAQDANHPNSFPNNSSANIKLSSTHISKTIQSDRFLDW